MTATATRFHPAVALGAALLMVIATACGESAGNAGTPDPAPPSAGGGTDTNPSMPTDAPFAERLAAASQRGVAYLLNCYGKPLRDGGWGPECPFLGYNGMALNALLGTYQPAPADSACVAETVAALVGAQERDGAWFSKPRGEAVYETSVILRALVRVALVEGAYDDRDALIDAIRRGRDYILSTQVDEVPEFPDDPTADESDPNYGGFGYGQRRGQRPSANLSVTHMAMGALDATTEVVPDEDDAVANARRKLRHFLRSVHNMRESDAGPMDVPTRDGSASTLPGTDGGGIYAPGVSAAGYDEGPRGTRVPRSYGSMTYALLQMYHIVGLPFDDPRVQAVYDWIRQAAHFTFEVHPGMPADPRNQPYQGHFYFLYSAASTLDKVVEGDTVVDTRGEAHNWKQELGTVLLDLQTDNGSWINSRDQSHQEGRPIVATCFAMMALGHLRPETE